MFARRDLVFIDQPRRCRGDRRRGGGDRVRAVNGPRRIRARRPRARQGLSTAATSDATDFSARRRHYRRGGGAAAAAAFAGIVGTGIAIAATQNRRHYYYDRRPAYYGGGPVYYGGGQPYYRSQPYYGGGHYGGYPSNHYGRGGAFDTLTPHHREY